MGQKILEPETVPKRHFTLDSQLKARKNMTRLAIRELTNSSGDGSINNMNKLDQLVNSFSIDKDPSKTRKIAASIFLGTTKFDPKIITSKNNKNFLISIFNQNSYLNK